MTQLLEFDFKYSNIDTVNLSPNMDTVNMPSIKNAYHHGNLRTELINSALSIVDNDGVEGVSIRKVARELGVAHSAPVNHFRDKKALLTALATKVFSDIAQTLRQQLLDSEASIAQKVHIISNTLVSFGLEQPHRYRLLWRGDCLDNDNAELNDAMNSIYDQLIAALSENHDQAIQSVESQAIALWSLLHGYVTMRLDGILVAKQDERSGLDRQSAIVDVFLNGIMAG